MFLPLSPQFYLVNFKHWLKKLYWKISNDEGERIHYVSTKPFFNKIPAFDDQEVNQKFSEDNQRWEHEEFVFKFSSVLVEPEFGYALSNVRTMLGRTMRKGRFVIPSPLRVIRAKYFKHQKNLEKAVLFDGSLGSNYFYFYAVLLHKIYLLEKFVRIESMPILVGTKTFNQSYFQELIKLERFSKLNWVEIETMLNVKELYVAVPMSYNSNYWHMTRSLFIDTETNLGENRAIFIDRTNRKISNFNQIRPILERYSIEIIDPANLTVAEQARKFNSAKYLVGIHGAGMANFFYSQHSKVRILEVAPKTWINSNVYWMSIMLGVNYDVLLGQGNKDIYAPFWLDPDKFEKKLKKLLAN